MAYDPSSFSARRPRETLGPISHNVSALPVPSSAMKRSHSTALGQAPHTATHVRSTSGSRMSLAPGRPTPLVFPRPSPGDNLTAMGLSTVHRQSTYNLQTTGRRKSFAPVTSTPAKPIQFQESTARRSSVYTARPSAAYGSVPRHSFFATAPPTNGIPADPRNLRTANTRTAMGQDIMEFLTERNFEMEMKHNLTHKTMTSPTQKDFDLMFQFLYRNIDPSYRFQKGIAAEIPPLLKRMGYPFEKNISKSQLSAVGGNNWSTFLGLLHWMMQMAKMTEQYTAGIWDDACAEEGFDVGSDRITFQFLSDAYKEWLSIDEDGNEEVEARRLQPHIDAMAIKFEQQNADNLKDCKMLEDEAKSLEDEIAELSKSAQRLVKLEEKIENYEKDRNILEAYTEKVEAKIQRNTEKAVSVEQDVEKIEVEAEDARVERDKYQQKVDAQGLSIQDINRMNSEREKLVKGVETTQSRLDEARERTTKKETETAAKLYELENAARQYNELGHRIGVMPVSAPNAHGINYVINLKLNAGPDFTITQLGSSYSQGLSSSDRLIWDQGSGYQPQHLLPNTDLKTNKQQLQTLRKQINERRNAIMEEDMGRVDMLDKTREALQDKDTELETLRHRVRVAQSEFEKVRETGNTQAMQSDMQIEKMEKELNRMRGGIGETVQLMEQREIEVGLEYGEMTRRSAALRDQLHTELEQMLSDIVQWKVHIQQSLERYEEFVDNASKREREEHEELENEMVSSYSRPMYDGDEIEE